MLTPSTTTVDLNVGYPNIATVVHAVQGDNQSRILTANLYDGGIAWTPPAGAIGVIKFRTPLGTSGMYDTDEEGNTAVTWSGNVATLRIVQNALAVAGDVPMQLSFYDDQGAVITSFLWETLVQPSVLTDTQFMQTDYYNILSQQISAILTAIADIPEPATSAPLMDGTAAVGTQNTFARGDHRHPTDTSRAPTNHASTGTSYGAGNASNYGHVKLSGSTSSTSGTSGGTAATPSAVKAAYDKADGKPDLSSTTPKMDGTAAAGTGTTAARADHVHPSDTSRVPTTRKVNNKALSADITLSASDVGAVPTTRKINNMDLTADRTLTAENIGYDDGLSEHTAGSTGEAIAELKGYLNAVEGDVADLETAINSLSSDDIANDSTKISGATVTAALDALRDNIKANTAWKNVSGSYGTLQAYYYESGTATTTYDLPENYVYVLCMQYKSARGAAIAIRWQSGAYRMWINTLHDTWSGWKQITPYTSINRFTLTANCWGTWGPASTTLASYTILETGFYDIWFCPTVNIKNDNSTRLRLYANSTLVAFGQVSSPTEIRIPLALRHMGQLTAGTVITLQCQCDVSLSDLRMLFASSETQSSDLMNHFVHRIY